MRLSKKQALEAVDMTAPPVVEEVSLEKSYRDVIPLSTGEGEVICTLTSEGFYFTLVHKAAKRQSEAEMLEQDTICWDPVPCLFLTLHSRNHELILGRIAEAYHIQGNVLQEFFAQALSYIGCQPQDFPLNAGNGILNGDQIDHIRELGFTNMRQGDLKTRDTSPENGHPAKQAQWNNDLEEARDSFTRYKQGEALEEGKTYAEWCRSGSMLLQLALVEEAANGLEAAREMLELTRLHFINAERNAPFDNWEVAKLGILHQIEYAGCLARLAASRHLEDYDKTKITPRSTKGRSRRDVLFESAVEMYEDADARMPLNAPLQLRYLVGSGKAQAYTLRGKYEDETRNNPASENSDPNHTSGNLNYERALEELMRLVEELPPQGDGDIMTKIQQQVVDMQEIQSGSHIANDKEPIADRELRHFTEEVLALA